MLAFLSRRLARSRGGSARSDVRKTPEAAVGPSAFNPPHRRSVAPTPSLHSATRDYARAVAAGYFARVRPHDLAPLIEAMGVDLWAWQYARRLTGQTPWRAGLTAAEAFERARAAREMTEDLATWERAIAVLDVLADRCRITGERPPHSLAVPAEIRSAIEARRIAVAERATGRRERAGAGRTGSVPLPDDAVHHPPYPGKRPP